MDIGIILGISMGIGLILMGIVTSNGELISFWNLPSILITLGGTLASGIVHYGWEKFRGLYRLTRIALDARSASPHATIALLVRFAEKARREGLLAMEDEAQNLDDDFLRNGLQLVVDGIDPDLVRNILEIELAFLEERHRTGQGIFEYLGSQAPAWGMIGTLVGLVIMLANLEDPNAIGPGLAVALVTTFYGSVLANLVFVPIGGKLRLNSEGEILLKEVMMEGILSIQAGENPAIVEQKLKAFLAPAAREAEPADEEDEEAETEPAGVMTGAR